MQKIPKSGYASVLAIALGACTMAANGSGEGPSATASAPAPLPDGNLSRTTEGGGLATLTVADGQPVAYTVQRADGSVYTAPVVRRLPNGDIRVENARITGVEAGSDSVSGTWRLGGESFPVTFSL